MDSTLQFVRGRGLLSIFPFAPRRTCVGSGRGEAGAQRGLGTTRPAGAESGLALVCTPGSRIREGLEVEPAGSAGGSLRACTAFRVFVGPGIGGIPHHFLEPQFLCFLSEGLSATQGLCEALMRGWDTDPSPVPGLWGGVVPDPTNVVPAKLRAPVPGVCIHQPWPVSGALRVLGHFAALGPFGHIP